MIQITAYLRDEEDLKKWKALKNKSEFLHDALNEKPFKISGVIKTEWEEADKLLGKPIKSAGDITPVMRKINQTPGAEIIKTPEEVDPILVPKVAKNIDIYSNGLCKIHKTPLDDRGKCLQKGCKYA